MIADDVTPPSAQGDDDRLGGPGSAHLPTLPGINRKVGLDELEHALTHITDTLLNTVTQGEAKAAAELVRNNIGVIIDGLWTSVHYRKLGHRDIEGDSHWMQITSWVPADVADVAFHVASKVTL